jgi:cell shape-determining protein MreC
VPVYSVNRRRAIVLLILSSVLLLTLDLRGNPFFDRVRSVFARVLEPFETAGEVIATPVRNAWHGATDYQELQRENERLRDLIAQQTGDQLAARSIYSDYQELLTLNGLTARYPTVTARVVGGAPGNFEQTVEIDRGSDDQLRVGMPVVNFAGVVGKITKVYSDRSIVRLITDTEYTIPCKVSGLVTPGPATDPSSTTTTVNTTPSGIDRTDLSTTTTTTTMPPSTTTLPGQGSTAASVEASAESTVPGQTTTTTSPSTTTTVAPVYEDRETGGCSGRGINRLPAMDLITENPAFGSIDVGAVVTTTGGSDSLAPPGLVIGEVINKVEGRGSAGPLLEIKLAADLDHLNLVQVLLYTSADEAPG